MNRVAQSSQVFASADPKHSLMSNNHSFGSGGRYTNAGGGSNPVRFNNSTNIRSNTTRPPAANKGVTRPKGWNTMASKKGGGVKFVDPKNPHNNIRQMPGNPNSPNSAQQNPYVIYKKNGVAYDVNGNPLKSATDPNAHIPLNKFNINFMPKFD